MQQSLLFYGVGAPLKANNALDHCHSLSMASTRDEQQAGDAVHTPVGYARDQTGPDIDVDTTCHTSVAALPNSHTFGLLAV